MLRKTPGTQILELTGKRRRGTKQVRCKRHIGPASIDLADVAGAATSGGRPFTAVTLVSPTRPIHLKAGNIQLLIWSVIPPYNTDNREA